MIKEIELNIPTDWSSVTLEKYLDLQKELKNYADDEEAMTAIMLYKLCGLDPNYFRGLEIDAYKEIKIALDAFINKVELPLQRIIKVDGVEYGFEPNLSNIAYGAYADITKFQTMTIDENWGKIMAILYRPVIQKKGDTYQIKSYDGTIDETKMLSVGMDVHFGALFFFVRLSMDLAKSILNYTKGKEQVPNIKSILERSGELMRQSIHLQTEISLNTKK